jgi:hypothetical protein
MFLYYLLFLSIQRKQLFKENNFFSKQFTKFIFLSLGQHIFSLLGVQNFGLTKAGKFYLNIFKFRQKF